MLPEGWTTAPLGTCAKFLSGGTPSKAEEDYWGGDFPWITVRDMKSLRLENAGLTLTEKGAAVSSIAPQNAVLVVTRGMALLKDLPVGITTRPMAFNQDIKALVANEGIDPQFLAYQLQANKAAILDLVDTAGHGTGRLDTDLLKQFAIPVAPEKEQQKIASRIRLWDDAITTTEKLLSNSRRQKQDLMQGLLSGRRHFLGGRATWASCDFNQVFERVTRKNTVGNRIVLTISAQHGLISQRDYFNKSVASANLQGYTLLTRGDFAYNKSYSAGYPLGAIKPLQAYDAGVVSSLYLCFRLRPDAPADADFFRHYFEAGMLNEEISGIAQEGARNHGLLNVSVTDFFQLRLYVPELETQRRIAEVLNAAEADEFSLLAQLERLRQEKRALMQDLLTGKRRVKLPSTDTVATPP